MTALTRIHFQEGNWDLLATASGEFVVKLWDPYSLQCLQLIKETGHIFSIGYQMGEGMLLMDRFSAGRNEKRGLVIWKMS